MLPDLGRLDAAVEVLPFRPPVGGACAAHFAAPRKARVNAWRVGWRRYMLRGKSREHSMRVLGAVAAMTALVGMMALAAPARAQMGGGGGGDGPHMNLLSDTPSKTPDEIEADKAKDKAYKESLRKIPDAKTSNDPWGTVRSDAPKAAPAAKTSSTAKAKTKTGSANPN